MKYITSKEKPRNKRNNNNILNIGYDSTQPSNESSVQVSSYSEMIKQLQNENSNIYYDDNNNNNDIMSDNTSNFVKSRRNSTSNK